MSGRTTEAGAVDDSVPDDGTTSTSRPRRTTASEAVIAAGLAVVFGVALVLTRDWSFRAALTPVLVCVVGLALSVLHLLAALRAGRRSGGAAEDHVAEHDPAYVLTTSTGPARRNTLLWIVGFFAATWLVGLLPTAVAFAAAYLRVAARAHLLYCLVYAALLGATLWLLMVLTELPVPDGVFA